MSSQVIVPGPLTSVRIKQILFATDFSPACAAAFPYVRSIAQKQKATVCLVHVIPPEPRSSVPMDTMSEELVQTRREAESQMKQFLGGDPLNGIQHSIVIERGDVLPVIEKAVKSYNIDLVIVGTHGRGGVRQILMGSVAETIFRDVTCPVLTVGPGVQNRATFTGQIQTVLFATDFSEGSYHALPYAITLARENGASLKLLHVCNDVGTTPYLLDRALVDSQKKLATLVPPEAGLLHTPECLVKVGSPADGIIEAAHTLNADMIVMGAHRAKWAASTHLPWAVVHVVAATAPCPVLTVRS